MNEKCELTEMLTKEMHYVKILVYILCYRYLLKFKFITSTSVNKHI